MPAAMTFAWLTAGGGLILALLLIGALLPRPRPEYVLMPYQRLGSEKPSASQYASQGGSSGKGEGNRIGDQPKDQGKPSANEKDGKAAGKDKDASSGEKDKGSSSGEKDKGEGSKASERDKGSGEKDKGRDGSSKCRTSRPQNPTNRGQKRLNPPRKTRPRAGGNNELPTTPRLLRGLNPHGTWPRCWPALPRS